MRLTFLIDELDPAQRAALSNLAEMVAVLSPVDVLNYRRKLSSRGVIFSPKARQRLVGLGCFEVLTFGNHFATDPILRVSPTQFPPMLPPPLDTMIFSLAPMEFVINAAPWGTPSCRLWTSDTGAKPSQQS